MNSKVFDMVGTLKHIAKRCLEIPNGCGSPLLQGQAEAWLPYYKFLYSVVAHYQPEAAVECGVYLGGATGHMAYGHPDTLVIGIDLEQTKDAGLMATNFRNIKYVVGDSTTEYAFRVVQSLLTGKKIELLFLDSQHDGVTPEKEFELYRPLFGPYCIVACDDIEAKWAGDCTHKAMQEFWHDLPGEKIELNFLHPSYGEVGLPGFGVSIVQRGDY